MIYILGVAMIVLAHYLLLTVVNNTLLKDSLKQAEEEIKERISEIDRLEIEAGYLRKLNEEYYSELRSKAIRYVVTSSGRIIKNENVRSK